MSTFMRWWKTLDRPERIVAMSLTVGGIVAITNSTVWAIASCYMVRQRAQVALWRATAPVATEVAHEAALADELATLESLDEMDDAPMGRMSQPQ